MKDDRIYVEHILQSIERIQSNISGKDHEAFLNESITQDAVVRQLEIIGEATKRISKELWKNNPDLPWDDMAGMRDVLIHDYIDVDLNIVWKTASESIPGSKPNTSTIIRIFFLFSCKTLIMKIEEFIKNHPAVILSYQYN